MRPLLILLIMLALGAGPLLSCTAGTPDTVRTEPQSERENKIGALIKDYERKIRDLDAKAGSGAGTSQKEIRRSLDDLKKQHQEASRTLEELRNATNRAWKDVNARLQTELEDLKKAYDRTREQMN